MPSSLSYLVSCRGLYSGASATQTGQFSYSLSGINPQEVYDAAKALQGKLYEKVGTIFQAASGQAVTIYAGVIPGLNGGPSGTGYTDNQRPNIVSGTDCRADWICCLMCAFCPIHTSSRNCARTPGATRR